MTIPNMPQTTNSNELSQGTIIARKPKHGTQAEYIVVRHYNGMYVSATMDAWSQRHGEWYWGHYFRTEQDAMQHFNNR